MKKFSFISNKYFKGCICVFHTLAFSYIITSFFLNFWIYVEFRDIGISKRAGVFKICDNEKCQFYNTKLRIYFLIRNYQSVVYNACNFSMFCFCLFNCKYYWHIFQRYFKLSLDTRFINLYLLILKVLFVLATGIIISVIFIKFKKAVVILLN